MIDGKLYSPLDFHISGVNLLHFRGLKDPLYPNSKREPLCYENAPVKIEIEHADGHKVLKKYTDSQFKEVELFMRQEYRKRFGSD